MAVVTFSTGGQACLPPCRPAGKLPLHTGHPPLEPGGSGACSAEALAQLFHWAGRGALRAHARAEQLARCLMEGRIDLGSIRLPWLPPPAPLPVLKQQLAKAGSPGIAEGNGHARLRLGAYVLAAAMAVPGDRVLLEAPSLSACRPDVTLIGRDGTRRLGLEFNACGDAVCVSSGT